MYSIYQLPHIWYQCIIAKLTSASCDQNWGLQLNQGFLLSTAGVLSLQHKVYLYISLDPYVPAGITKAVSIRLEMNIVVQQF